MIFRQLFDSVSSTYTYLLASRRGGEALIIDPVLEKVDRYIQLLHDTHTHTNYSPEYLMKTDIKIFYKILQNAFNITLEGSYTIINWDSFQGCKNILNFINQCGIPY